MQNYTTQMDAARKGIVTPEMEIVAKKEYRTTEEIRQLVAEGQVAIPANKHHTCLNPEGVGSMLRTKINVNLGVSRDCKDYNIEMQKVMSAVNMGAEAIMDLSSHGNTQPFRQKLTHECPVMIGTVPVYDSVIHYQRDLATLARRSLWLAQSPCRPQASADGGGLLRHFAVCGLRRPADRHHAQPFYGQGWFPDRHVCGAGAGVRAVSGAAGQCPALAEHGHRRGRALPALHEKRLWRH